MWNKILEELLAITAAFLIASALYAFVFVASFVFDPF